MGPLAHLDATFANLTSIIFVAVEGRGGDPANLSTGDAEGAINNLLDSLPWMNPLLSAIGAVLAIFMVSKFLIDKNKGQQGGAGSKAGQAAGAALGLALFFAPTLIATMFDWGLTVVASFFSWLGGVFSTG